MKMDEDNRPDENSEEEESDAGWYFDLPKGAWERQEAKNRELRQSVRRNMDSEPPKRDAFGPRDEGRDLRNEDEPSSWRAVHGNEPDDQGADKPRWTLPSELRDEPQDESPLEYSTEPEHPAEIPLKLRSQRLRDEDEHPTLKPPPGLFGHHETEESPWSAAPEAPKAVDPPPHRFAPRPSVNDEEEARPFVRGDLPPTPPAEEHRSRWGEIFSEKASDGATMLEGMRAWAKSTDAGPAEPPSSDEPVARWDQPEIDPGQPPAPIPIRVRRHDDDEPPLVNTENPQSRWDQMFGGKAADDAGMLEGMRAWAAKPQDGDEADALPRRRLAGEPDEVDETLLRPFAWEEGTDSTPAGHAAPFQEDPDVKQGIFGKLFGKKKKAGYAEPPHPVGSDAPWAPADAPEEFAPGLSFGTSEETEPGGSWLGRADGSENRFASAPGSDPAPPWPPASNLPPADSPWTFQEDDDRRDVRAVAHGAPAGGAAEPAEEHPPETPPADEPSPAITAPAWAFAREDAGTPTAEPATRRAPLAPAEAGEDDGGWSPEAFDAPVPPAAIAASASDADPVTDWLSDELTPAARATGLPPIADEEDPWRSLDRAESEGPAVDTPEWAPAATTEHGADTAETPATDAPVAEVPPSPSTIPPDPDDPWVAFVASRELAGHEPAGSAGGPPHDQRDSAADDSDAGEDEAPWAAIAASAAAGAAIAGLSSGHDDPPGQPPATGDAGQSDREGSLWDSSFARIHDSQLAEEPPPAEDTPPVDDPWAAIAEASGVEPGSAEIAVFRGSAEVEDALERYEAEREAEEAVEATAPTAFPAAIDPDASEGVALPAWDDSKLEDDTVLRAFEAHASLFEGDDEFSEMPPPVSDTEPVVFDDLLGEDADEIVAEASQQPVENRYLGRMQGWAPQRANAPGGRQVFPWETETEDRDRQPQPSAADDDEPVLEGWSRVEEPPTPWTTTAAAAHAEAPSARRKSRSRMLVREIVETGLLALLVFLAVRASFQNFKVDGLSMYPTLEDGEYLIVNKLAYAEVDMDRLGNFVPFVEAGDDPTRQVFGGPERGDIVVLEDPREQNTDLIKRIIGLPGETIEIVDGEVYINDFLLTEPYIKQEWDDTKEKILIPEGYYFVMGDNRSNSLDSRNGGIGLISEDLIIGKAALTYWPRSKFGLAPNESGDISEKDGRPTITTQKLDD